MPKYGRRFIRGFGEPGRDMIVDRGQMDAVGKLKGWDKHLLVERFPTFRPRFKVGE